MLTVLCFMFLDCCSFLAAFMKETGKIYSVRIVFARSEMGNNKTNFINEMRNRFLANV